MLALLTDVLPELGPALTGGAFLFHLSQSFDASCTNISLSGHHRLPPGAQLATLTRGTEVYPGM
jgi:hypothetical protein